MSQYSRLLYKCRKKNYGVNNNQMSLPGMYQECNLPQNSVSVNNHQSNNPQDNSTNTYRIQLNLSQLAYISKLFPPFYSLQLEPKPLKRAPSSQKNIKEEIKPPVEVKKISTKEETKPPSINKINSRNQKNNNKSNEEIQNAVYEKYNNPQKDLSKRNPFQNVSESLRPCIRILNLLKNSRTSWPFRDPVDPIALGIPHYTQIVKEPMDLSSIENNLKTDQYLTPTQFHADVSKIVTNSYTFNSTNAQFTRITAEFESYYRKITSEPNGQYQRTYSHTEIPVEYSAPKISIDKKISKKQSVKEGNSYSGYNGPTITMNEKKQLGLNIKKLPKEHMKGILDIVNEGKVKAIGEFDLKELDPNIIRKLQNYVQQKLTGQTKNKANYPDKSKQQEDRQESSFQLSEDDS